MDFIRDVSYSDVGVKCQALTFTQPAQVNLRRVNFRYFLAQAGLII